MLDEEVLATNDGRQDAPEAPPSDKAPYQMTEADKALLKRIRKTILADRTHHKKAYDRMRRDMRVAMHGHESSWAEDRYIANITGRHVRLKTDALYAKNPKVVAHRRETLDFAVWDETQQSLMGAMATMQAAANMTQPVTTDPATGQAMPQEPQLPPGFQEAQALLQDFQAGTTRRQQVKRIGKTLEVLYARAMTAQQPLDFKTALKNTVRRTCTTGVGYVEVGFQREMGRREGYEEKLADAQQRLAHLQGLVDRAAEGEISGDDAEIAELETMIQALQQEPEVVLREGLVFDYPQSTKVIPDRLCKSLVGFVGARHVAVEYDYTPQQVQEIFGVDLKKNFKSYAPIDAEGKQLEMFDTEEAEGGNLCRVWKFYDKVAGLVYYICDGYECYLRAPAPPDVYVTTFWPLHAVTFNAVEHEDELFPPSDVTLLIHMQREYNRSRDGKREHRRAARPRWAHLKGTMTDEELTTLANAEPFENVALTLPPATKIGDVLSVVPVPGVDPNLYDVNEILTDTQLVVGSQRSQLGAPAKTTATSSALSANMLQMADSSSVDDLDSFLTAIARTSSQILMREMSEEIVMREVGPGAFWPQQSLEDIFDELWLEVEAGSTGKPNQAMEIANWEKMLPFLLQMKNISPTWLAREALRRLDDRADLTEALTEQMPSLVAQNRMDAAPPQPGGLPEDQGPQGANNGPPPPGGPAGSGAPMGNNRA